MRRAFDVGPLHLVLNTSQYILLQLAVALGRPMKKSFLDDIFPASLVISIEIGMRQDERQK